MKKLLAQTLFLVLLMPACTPDETTVGIARHPVLAFTTPTLTWQANRYSFATPTQVVAYPADTTLPGRLYSRLTLQGTGQTDQGNNLQLILMFDTEDASQLIGTYRPLYTTSRGLAQVQLFDLDGNAPAAYALRPGDSTAVLQIQRQSQAERLIAGRFQMTLYNTRDTAETIAITTGTLTDIRY